MTTAKLWSYQSGGLDLPATTTADAPDATAPELAGTSNTLKDIVDRRERWVRELRSGKFTQVQGRLQRTASHEDGAGLCCLGVACATDADIAAQTSDWQILSVLSEASMELLGMSQSEMQYLVTMNDTKNRSFDEIADQIDRQTVQMKHGNTLYPHPDKPGYDG